VRLALRRARRTGVRFVALRLLGPRCGEFGLDEAACRKALHFAGDGGVSSGARAVNDVAAALGAGWLVSPFRHFPRLLALEESAYAWVAANRTRISCGDRSRRQGDERPVADTAERRAPEAR
jgi:predicted DCC family thiol-disulfide oxidoreductase YuxK